MTGNVHIQRKEKDVQRLDDDYLLELNYTIPWLVQVVNLGSIPCLTK